MDFCMDINFCMDYQSYYPAGRSAWGLGPRKSVLESLRVDAMHQASQAHIEVKKGLDTEGRHYQSNSIDKLWEYIWETPLNGNIWYIYIHVNNVG
jgi:hypothetical protein